MDIEKIRNIGLDKLVTQVYDFDSLTTDELMCKFAQKINIIIEHFNYLDKQCQNNNENMKLKLDYLLGQGLEEQVAKELLEKIKDGTIGKLINENLLNDINEQLDNIENEKADNEKVENIIKQDYSKIFKKIKATNFYVPYNVSEFGDYKTIINNIKRVGNTHISFCIRLSMTEKTSNDIYKEVSDDLVLEYVNYAISKGLKIIVKFHVGGAAGGGSANIQPTNTSLWIKSLRDIALSYCDLLGDRIDIVCLSNECTYQTNQCYDDWKDYNDRVKAKNPKYITTTACTDVEMATTVLYDIVDILGVNLYIGIGGDLKTPQYQRDKNMFVNYSDKENKIRELIYHAKKHNKPFYITEVGCTPCVLALKYPAKWDYDEFVRNVEAQKVYYETFLKCFMNMEIIKGVFLWCANDGFTYFDNPAEDVVEKYFMEV